MTTVLTAIFAALPTGIAETIQGGIVSLMVSGFRKALGEDHWNSWGPIAKIGAVVVVSALWSGATGMAGGLTGAALVTHIVGAAVAALGIRQMVKVPKKIKERGGKLPLP